MDTTNSSPTAGIYHPAGARAPGVYYETSVARVERPAFRTGIPVFVGFIDSPTLDKRDASPSYRIDRWAQFHHLYVPLRNSYLSHAVRGFFENGGEQCVVLPVRSDKNSSAGMIKALKDVFTDGGVLDDLEDIDLVCVPDAMFGAIKKDRYDSVREIQSAVLEHCGRMGDRFAILDGYDMDTSPPDGQEAAGKGSIDCAVLHWQSLPREHGAYGALYYPWVSVRNSHSLQISDDAPIMEMPCDKNPMESFDFWGYRDSSSKVLVPPCGHVAGIYSRSDARVGVHKAPANELLEEVFALEINYRDAELAAMNDAGINCLHGVAGRGIRVWGARTLSGQPDQSYVNVRRLFLTLTRWIRKNMNDMVYEFNNPRLWERVRERLTDYCRNLFDQGALKGNSPAQAFHVKCDAETNTLEDREAGRVVAEVSLAPTIPAEFVVVRITQSAGTINVTGLNLS